MESRAGLRPQGPAELLPLGCAPAPLMFSSLVYGTVLWAGTFPSEEPPTASLPVLGVRVLKQLGQLQRVLADLLHRGQQEAIQGDVDHLL